MQSYLRIALVLLAILSAIDVRADDAEKAPSFTVAVQAPEADDNEYKLVYTFKGKKGHGVTHSHLEFRYPNTDVAKYSASSKNGVRPDQAGNVEVTLIIGVTLLPAKDGKPQQLKFQLDHKQPNGGGALGSWTVDYQKPVKNVKDLVTDAFEGDELPVGEKTVFALVAGCPVYFRLRTEVY